MADFAICNNILVNFDSHETKVDGGVFKLFGEKELEKSKLVKTVPDLASRPAQIENLGHYSSPLSLRGEKNNDFCSGATKAGRLSEYKLTKISDIYDDYDKLKNKDENKELMFLDENLEEIKVKSITKEQYKGRIYDVTVPNHIILVKRDGLITWSGNSYIHNFTSLGDGDYTLKAYAQDLAGNVNNTELRTITVAEPPTAEFIAPANESYLDSGTQNFTVNLTENTGLANATLNIYDSAGALYNQTIETLSGVVQKIVGIVVELADDAYTWFWDVLDTAGNLLRTGNRTTTIDTTVPVFTWHEPTPANNSGKTDSFVVNISITDVNLANVTYTWNGTNTTYNASNLTSLGSNEWLFNLTQEDIVLGETYNYTISAIDLAGNHNTTETRVVIGNSWPAIVNITHKPTTGHNLDPGILINITVNVTDTDENFDSAILQWRKNTDAWNNVTMDNATAKSTYTLLNATFTPTGEGNHSFRIFFNDSEGVSNTSTPTNLSVFWECTWTVTPASISQVTGWDVNKEIANITINNTGDYNYSSSNCQLNFRLTHDLPAGRIYFDNLASNRWYTTYDVTIAANSTRNISINATFQDEILEEDFRITVTDTNRISSNSSANVTGTVISSQGGPYLYETIESAPTSLYLTLQDFDLKSYIRNVVGDDTAANTAYNVTFNWTLPSGFLIEQGAAAVSYTNLSNNTIHYNNLSMVFNSTGLPSMSPGTFTIYLYARGYNSSGNLITQRGNTTLLTKTANITLLCYSNVSDGVYVRACGELDADYTEEGTAGPSVSMGGGGGGSGSGAGGYVSRFLKTEESYEVVRGEQQEFTVKFENPYNDAVLINLSMGLEGIFSEYLEVSPAHIERLSEKEAINLAVKIKAPAYFSEGVYNLTLIMNGRYIRNMTFADFESRKYLSLKILEISRDLAIKYLNNTEEMIKKMMLSGLHTKDAERMYGDMNSQYRKDRLGPLQEKFLELKDLYETAYEVMEMLESIKQSTGTAELKGIETSETSKLINLAESAFLRGDYYTALSRLKEAQLSYAVEVKGEFHPIYYIRTYPKETGGMAAFTVFLFFNTSLFFTWRRLKRKLKLLDYEEKLLIGLMKVVQKDCFDNKKMSMEEYQNTMIQYENRLHKVVQQKIETETKLANLLRLRGGKEKALRKEAGRLKELLEETQKLHFEKGKLETRIYENMLKSYASRLSEVEEKLAVIDAHKEIRRSRFNIFRK